MTWNKKNSLKRIQDAIAQTAEVEVTDLTSLAQLDDIPLKSARRVHGAHAYVSILNAPDLLDSDKTETARSHKRYLRFLHLYERAVHEVFRGLTARRVDFQNERLHFVSADPDQSEEDRVALAVAIADALQQVVKACNDHHPELGDARLRIGLDSGMSLAVRNGTRGDREPLYLGNPANLAARLLDGRKQGIFLTNTARKTLDAEWVVDEPDATPLTRAQVKHCVEQVDFSVDVEVIASKWKEEVQAMPQQEIKFSRPTPPLKDLDLEALTPANSRRIEAAVLYADIDGFTRFVANRIRSGAGQAEAVQALHVIRKELRDVLQDFGGRKIRYNGDCQVGLLAEGPRETDHERTVSRAVLCASAMRSSFELIRDELASVKALGLAIGIDAGPVAITRLGPKFSRARCAAGQAVVHAEEAQRACSGEETQLATAAFGWATEAVQEILPADTPTKGITYNETVARLDVLGDPAAKGLSVAAAVESVRPRAYAGRS